MYRVETTAEFDSWLDGIRDRIARKRINARLLRVEAGLLGDWKTVHDGVSEMRIDHGPGYRIYFTIRVEVVVILLCGSEKRDQERAMKLAKQLAKDI